MGRLQCPRVLCRTQYRVLEEGRGGGVDCSVHVCCAVNVTVLTSVTSKYHGQRELKDTPGHNSGPVLVIVAAAALRRKG